MSSQQKAKSKSKEKRRRNRRGSRRRSTSKRHRSSSRRRSGSRSSSKTKKSRKYPPYPCMDSVQRNLRDLYKAQNRQPVPLVALTNRMKTVCCEWRSSQNDAEKLIREFLEECELENMSRQVGPDTWVPRHRSSTSKKRESKSNSRKKQSRSRRTKRRRREGAPPAGESQIPIQAQPSPETAMQQQAEPQVAVQQAAVATAEVQRVKSRKSRKSRRDSSRTRGKHSHHKKRSSRASRCCRKCGDAVSDAEGLDAFSSRELTRLVKDLLAKDEVNFNCKHCLCDKCLGIQTERNLKCRRANSQSRCSSSGGSLATPSSCSSQCDTNMRVISKFLLEHQGSTATVGVGGQPAQAGSVVAGSSGQSSTATITGVASARPAV